MLSNISYINLPPLPFTLITSSPDSTGIISAFTYMCTHYLHSIHPHIPFPPSPPHSHLWHPSPLGRTCSTLQFSNFVEEKERKDEMKNITFSLIWNKENYIGNFLVIFLYYNPNWFIASNFLHSTLVHFL
jgi:hypothetical protein